MSTKIVEAQTLSGPEHPHYSVDNLQWRTRSPKLVIERYVQGF